MALENSRMQIKFHDELGDIPSNLLTLFIGRRDFMRFLRERMTTGKQRLE